MGHLFSLRIITGIGVRTSSERNHHENKGVSDRDRTLLSPSVQERGNEIQDFTERKQSARLWNDCYRTISPPTIQTVWAIDIDCSGIQGRSWTADRQRQDHAISPLMKGQSDNSCHNLGPDESAFLRILPNYLLTYLPMVTVMVANPILYLCSLRSVTDLITQSLAQYTRKERAIIDAVKVKFGLILLAFYICWLPNLINSLFLWFEWFNLPAQTVYVLLYIM
ncbi:hypothetical protein J6590_097186, partial [Homalodisca vitripennis]